MSIANPAPERRRKMFKFIGWAALIVFLIGLMVVFGFFDLLF
jgi:hypothetical protein